MLYYSLLCKKRIIAGKAISRKISRKNSPFISGKTHTCHPGSLNKLELDAIPWIGWIVGKELSMTKSLR